MTTKIHIRYGDHDKMELLKSLTETGIPFGMHENDITINSDHSLKIISILTLEHYDFSVTYNNE